MKPGTRVAHTRREINGKPVVGEVLATGERGYVTVRWQGQKKMEALPKAWLKRI